jgi:hypothetical protein
MFLDLLDPDPVILVKGTAPDRDPSWRKPYSCSNLFNLFTEEINPFWNIIIIIFHQLCPRAKYSGFAEFCNFLIKNRVAAICVDAGFRIRIDPDPGVFFKVIFFFYNYSCFLGDLLKIVIFFS